MTEVYISLYGAKAEAFESIKEEMGPDGVEPSNPAVVMRLIEEYEGRSNSKENEGISGGLTN
jgi:hypothetical protein